MTKRYLKTPEEVIDALQAGKAVFDFNGYRYKMYKRVIFWKDGKQWEVAFGLWLTDTIEYKLMGARSLRKKMTTILDSIGIIFSLWCIGVVIWWFSTEEW